MDEHDSKNMDEPMIDAVPVESLYQFYLEDFETIKRSKMIEVFNLDTYQGKVKDPETGYDSTNGCTVIAPLIAAQHLKSVYPGISDLHIENVIDLQAPKVLADVRTKLNLPKDALIIPSDVHDFLLDKSILKQEQFLGACGGNIQDEDHLGAFINMLAAKGTKEKRSNGYKKVAAALFFHEHVISVIKMVFPNGKCWYDVVDSLPYEKEKNVKPKRKCNFKFFGINNGESKVEEESAEEFCALRIRCKDLRSLEAALKWYSLSKFTDDDCTYINSHHWDEKRCYFDPRVFQAFVWTDLAQGI
uniref:Uncharacterized protein n=1 Tax=Leptocylindrus danicus TaxID=163516 RepID=A0A7S2KRE0_9STRA